MAALGTIPNVLETVEPTNPALLDVTDYNVNRGSYLGVIQTIEALPTNPTDLGIVSNYVVRQIRILYRQLWPSHGQRFPQ